jgi:hypothetical protein
MIWLMAQPLCLVAISQGLMKVQVFSHSRKSTIPRQMSSHVDLELKNSNSRFFRVQDFKLGIPSDGRYIAEVQASV